MSLSTEEKLMRDRIQLLRICKVLRQEIAQKNNTIAERDSSLHSLYALLRRNTGKRVGQIQPDILEALDIAIDPDEEKPLCKTQRESFAATRNLLMDQMRKDGIF